MVAEAAAERVVQRAAQLAAYSEEPDRLTRRFATPALVEVGALVRRWMEEAGMTTTLDAVGNVRGRIEGPFTSAPTLLIGSHLDTVRDAGRWDGVLGVLVGLAVAEAFHTDRGGPPIGLEVIGFADEEGVRYGIPYLGSSALAGTFDPAWLEYRDGEGIAMADAIRAAGGDPTAIATARRDPADLLGYVEVHLEQGPILEAEGLPLGVVTGIVGQSRARLTILGEAGHAGTVPQALRRDALCAAAEIVLVAESLAWRTPGLVATVGEIAVEPGVGNAIPGRAVIALDVRHEDETVRDGVVTELRDRAEGISATRGVSLGWETLTDQAAVACDAHLTAALEQAVAAGGATAPRLASGAGHDGAVLSRSFPIAMLFVRHPGGLSHRPDEAADAADIAAAIDAVSRVVELLAAEVGSAAPERS
ncbi:MAG: allantoate amidohydrolase [Solirubrobacterales bacterium]